MPQSYTTESAEKRLLKTLELNRIKLTILKNIDRVDEQLDGLVCLSLQQWQYRQARLMIGILGKIKAANITLTATRITNNQISRKIIT